MADPWSIVSSQRHRIADLLEELSPEELARGSLCGQWTVQQVAAHVAWAPTVAVGQLLRELARDRMRANATNARLGREWALRGPEAIVAALRDDEAIQHRTPGTRPADNAIDFVTHEIDMRVPLGRDEPAPEDARHLALSTYVGMGWPLSMAFARNPRRTAAGLRLEADDLDWSHGDGPTVQASSSALVRALTGRPVQPSELRGDGAPELLRRLGTPG
jgi:uncharacterized protein (TIGR03083 family)